MRGDGVAYTLEARSEVQAVAFAQNQREAVREVAVAGALAAEPGMKQQTYIAFGWQNSAQQGASASASHTPTLDKSKVPAVSHDMQVRRLTPRECERLQGFPDDYTLIPVKRVKPNRLLSPRAEYSYREIDGEVWQLAADGPRYKALGNSMAVPVMAFIGRRIAIVDAITTESERAA